MENLQIEDFPNKMLVFQLTYIKKVLKHLDMDKSQLLNFLMVVSSIEVKKDFICHKEDNGKILDLEVSYCSAIGALIYFINCTYYIIYYQLASCSFASTQKHRNEVKHI